VIEAHHFSTFFEAVHGPEPFPWQRKLAERVVSEGWPRVLDVPTGAGKTAAIDIAVFHLALEAFAQGANAEARREAPRRIFFIVDRRLVVDDAHARARKIADALNSATAGILKDMADALREFQGTAPGSRRSWGGDKVLRVARLRGAAPRDPDWLRTPSQPTVVVSTVDQIGSRLLFRGYGVSDTMKSLHAGLVGADALYLIDEAHLSRPFVDTVQSIFGIDEAEVPQPLQNRPMIAPFRLVTLSATPGAGGKHKPFERSAEDWRQKPFELSDEDRKHEILGERLKVAKTAAIVPEPVESDKLAFADALAQRAWGHSVFGDGSADVTCVVVNRVRRARQVFQNLEKRVADVSAGLPESEDEPRVVLLTGRTRAIARDRILETVAGRMRAPGKGEIRKPLIVVATQCVEAGADFDFDALVTEIAPLDCLRQRFGRLNRTGRAITTRASILAAVDQVGVRAEDPIYGKAAASTWKLLQEKGKKTKSGVELNFGINAANEWLPNPSEILEYLAPVKQAPVVLPAFVDRWSRTSPVPADDPEVALFLHGPQAGPPDVQIVWRADIEYESESKKTNEELESDWKNRVAACPPSSLETLSVPYWEALRWLGGDARGDVADVEGATDEALPSDFVQDRVLLWCGKEDARTGLLGPKRQRRPNFDDGTKETRARNRIRPGDTIVVPASRGGCDAWGWNPTSKVAVEDLAVEANVRHRRRHVLRLSAPILRLALDGDEVASRSMNLNAFVRQSADWSDKEVLAHINDLPIDLDREWFEEMPDHADIEVVRGEGGRLKDEVMALVYESESAEREPSDAGAGQAVTEDDDSVRGERRPVALRDHSQGVRDFARAFADRTGLASGLVDDIALAAFLHDAGKAHPNFKLWLYGGDSFLAEGREPLAKSGKARLPPRARERACLPLGARHEVASLFLAVEHPALRNAHDPELVLWLIGTHHGYGRPFFTEAEWPRSGEEFLVDLGDGEVRSRPAPQFAELQSEWLDLQVRMHEKYGPWGLARLEATLRLADHRRSEWEQLPESRQQTREAVT
jgi:CRISPR-associated endonuclease/helicase Cas3